MTLNVQLNNKALFSNYWQCRANLSPYSLSDLKESENILTIKVKNENTNTCQEKRSQSHGPKLLSPQDKNGKGHCVLKCPKKKSVQSQKEET